jgi:hypothetical protein
MRGESRNEKGEINRGRQRELEIAIEKERER